MTFLKFLARHLAVAGKFFINEFLSFIFSIRNHFFLPFRPDAYSMAGSPKSRPLKETLKANNMSDAEVQFIMDIMALNPDHRPSARKSKEHAYFYLC